METTQCFICQGETDPDPYGELEEASTLSSSENTQNIEQERQ
jgi:hypothetical protein